MSETEKLTWGTSLLDTLSINNLGASKMCVWGNMIICDMVVSWHTKPDIVYTLAFMAKKVHLSLL